MNYSKWQFRNDVLINELIERGLDYEEVLDFMARPKIGFYVLAFMIDDIEYQLAGLTKKVRMVGDVLLIDNDSLVDYMDTDVDMLWHWFYKIEVDVAIIGVHLWSDRIPYYFRLTKFVSGQAKLMMDALESYLSVRPTRVLILGSASDSWRSGLASELLFWYTDVKDIVAYDVFEVGGVYTCDERKLEFVPSSVFSVDVCDSDLVIDDRWPVLKPVKAKNFSTKCITKKECRQPFYKTDGSYETRVRSVVNRYEEYFPLRCNCYECAYFYNMMNFYGVSEKDVQVFYEIIFSEAGHLNMHNSEIYINFLLQVFIRRNRINSVSEIDMSLFDRSDVDKFLGKKIGFLGSDRVSCSDGMLIIKGHVYKGDSRGIIPVIDIKPDGAGYDTRVTRFDSSYKYFQGDGGGVFEMFTRVPIVSIAKSTRFKSKGRNVVVKGDRPDAWVVGGRIQMAGLIVISDDFTQVQVSSLDLTSIPKGHVAVGELFHEAAVREYVEETSTLNPLPSYGNILRSDKYDVRYNGYDFTFYLFAYSCGGGKNYVPIRDLVLEQKLMVLDVVAKLKVIRGQQLFKEGILSLSIDSVFDEGGFYCFPPVNSKNVRKTGEFALPSDFKNVRRKKTRLK